jgi:hypothetical protein
MPFYFALPPSPLLLALGVLKLYPEIDIQPPAPLRRFPLDDLPKI